MKIIQAKQIIDIEALQWSGRNIKQFKDLFNSIGIQFDEIIDGQLYFKTKEKGLDFINKKEFFIFYFTEFEELCYDIVSEKDFNSSGDYEF